MNKKETLRFVDFGFKPIHKVSSKISRNQIDDRCDINWPSIVAVKKTEECFNQTLTIGGVILPFILTKSMLVIENLINYFTHSSTAPLEPCFVQMFAGDRKQMSYSVEIENVQQMDLAVENERLDMSRDRQRNIDSSLFSSLEPLNYLNLGDNQLESLDDAILARCRNLWDLDLTNAFHPDAKFSLTFLRPVAQTLTSLLLTLPEGPLDFSAFSCMDNLKELKIYGASSLDTNREYQKLTKQHLSEINTTKLASLRLTHFDLPTIDQETFQIFNKLTILYLTNCHIKCIHSEAFKHSFGALEILDLSHNKIAQLEENTFAGLSSLTRLDLEFNEISSLGSECFAGLRKLIELSLRGNRIRDLEQSVLERLLSLKTLNLAKNQLTRINRNSFNQLNWLYLDYNPIQTIEDDAFENAKKLERLTLSYCKLKVINNRMFTGLTKLKTLRLDNNLIDSFQIKTDDGELIEIKNANMTPRELLMAQMHLFSDSESIKGISLGGNQFTKLDLRLFSNLRNLFDLDLSSNKINELNHQGIDGAFDFHVNIKLDGNQLTNEPENAFNDVTNCEGIVHVDEEEPFRVSNKQPQALQTILGLDKRKSINSFSLRNCQLKTSDDFEIPANFQKLEHFDLRSNMLDRVNLRWFQSMNTLQSLYLSNNRVESLDHDSLFANCPNLERLDLSANLLRSISRRLFHGLYNLKRLNLSDNPELSRIDDGLFRSLFSLTEVNLSGNNIKQLNLQRLFKSCHFICKLDLSRNQLDSQTFQYEKLGNLVQLESLDLSDNQLEDFEFVRDMDDLRFLMLKNNKIESIEKDGVNILGRLRSLQELDLSGNPLQPRSKELLPR